jgi:Restriction endonuclease
MSIWEHRITVHETLGFMTSFAGVPAGEFSYHTKGAKFTGTERGDYVTQLWDEQQCPFCRQSLTAISPTKEDFGTRKALHVCAVCGWWKAKNKTLLPGAFMQVAQAGALLRALDMTDMSIPIGEVQSYLAGRYEARYDIHPQVFEETVASVFRGLGFKATTTAYSNDGGIDILLQRANETIGVQVKRYKDSIQVSQIRELAGALMIAGITKGVFVTTSRFSSGATRASEILTQKGLPIELVDAEKFYDALRIARRPMYKSIEDFEEMLPLCYLPVIYHGPGDLTSLDLR